jgi:hypothetical protein
VGTNVTVRATFNEALDPASVGPQTFELRDPSNALVAANVTYDAATATARLSPNAALVQGVTYTASLKAGISDLVGNTTSSAYAWTFITTPPPGAECPCSLWSGSTEPANQDSFDTEPVELGVKFRSDISGYITAIRFYKGPNDIGTHVVNLWTSDGALLSTATSTNESALGWQQVQLPNPIPVSANTTYVASYHSSGRYPYSGAYFQASGVDNGLLHTPSSNAAGGNGVYRYGSSGFPNSTYNATNYWVDVVFQP